MFETGTHSTGFEGEDRLATWAESSRSATEVFPTPEPIPSLTAEPNQTSASPEPEPDGSSPDSNEQQTDPGEAVVATYLGQGWSEVTGEEGRDRFFIENGALVSVAADGRRFEQTGEAAAWVTQILEQGYASFEYQKNGKHEVFLTVLVGNELVSRILRAPEREEKEPAETNPAAPEVAEARPVEAVTETEELAESVEAAEPEPIVIDLGAYLTAQVETEGSAEAPSETVLDFRELFQREELTPLGLAASQAHREPVNENLDTREAETVRPPQLAPLETAESGIQLVRFSETSPVNEPGTADRRIGFPTLTERDRIMAVSTNPENLTGSAREDRSARVDQIDPSAKYLNVDLRGPGSADLPATQETTVTREPLLQQPPGANRAALAAKKPDPIQHAAARREPGLITQETAMPNIAEEERREAQGDVERPQTAPEATTVEPAIAAVHPVSERTVAIKPSVKPVAGNEPPATVQRAEQPSQADAEGRTEPTDMVPSYEKPTEREPQPVRPERERGGQPSQVRVPEVSVRHEPRADVPRVERTGTAAEDFGHHTGATDHKDQRTEEQKGLGQAVRGTEQDIATLGRAEANRTATRETTAVRTEPNGQAGTGQVAAARPAAQTERSSEAFRGTANENRRSPLGERAVDRRKAAGMGTVPGGQVRTFPQETVLTRNDAPEEQAEWFTVPHLVHEHTRTQPPASRQIESLTAERVETIAARRTNLTPSQKLTRQVLSPGVRVVFRTPTGKRLEYFEDRRRAEPSPKTATAQTIGAQVRRHDLEVTAQRIAASATAQNDQSAAALPHQPAGQVRSAA